MILSSSDLTILRARHKPDGTTLSRLVEALNQEEPFGVMFREDGDQITLSLPNGVSLLNWVRRYNTRTALAAEGMFHAPGPLSESDQERIAALLDGKLD